MSAVTRTSPRTAPQALPLRAGLALVAGAAFLAATLPHFADHLTTTASFSTGDNVASLGSFVLELALVGLAMRAVARNPNHRKEPLMKRLAPVQPRGLDPIRRLTYAAARRMYGSAAEGVGKFPLSAADRMRVVP